jgi:glyoxylase-like metal-dependent hydrolase (beta-lactamase superfamily II)
MANFEPVKVDITYNDGDIIDLGGKKLEIIHIPGHSADSISVVDNDLGVYICGDSMQGGGSSQPNIFHNVAEYTASARRLLNKSIKTLVNGHPFRPYNKGVLRGDECSEQIQESLREVSKIRSNVLKTLRAEERPMSLTEISERLGLPRAVAVGCVLEAMIEDREAEKIFKNTNVLWRAK